MGADDLMRSTEARAQQGSVVASPPVLPPPVNASTSTFRAGGPSMYETRTDEKLSEGIVVLQEDSHKTRGEYDIEVQVDTSIIRETR